ATTTTASKPVSTTMTAARPVTTRKPAATTTTASGMTQAIHTNAATTPAVTRIVAGTKANAAVTPGRPVASATVQAAAHMDDQVTYQYNALGRRDPFSSLLTGEYVGADVGGDVPPDVGCLKVVGIVWGDADQFALV